MVLSEIVRNLFRYLARALEVYPGLFYKHFKLLEPNIISRASINTISVVM
jgi:hypothetical protein